MTKITIAYHDSPVLPGAGDEGAEPLAALVVVGLPCAGDGRPWRDSLLIN